MSVIVETPIDGAVLEAQLVDGGSRRFLESVLDAPERFHYLSRDTFFRPVMPGASRDGAFGYPVPTVSPLIQALHGAFSAHVPFSLRPDVLWYVVVHEVAEHVRQHADEYAAMFTDTPATRQLIEVRDDTLSYDEPSDWARSIELIREPLRDRIGDESARLFLPQFSTSTREDETALLVALMDVVSPYYEFQWTTLCGIPRIRLEGTVEDWFLLASRVAAIGRRFNGLREYAAELRPILLTLAKTADGASIDEEFWRSIYKYSDGSGGAYVTGWITAFFAYWRTRDGAEARTRLDWRRYVGRSDAGMTTNAFPAHVSRVPFAWQYFDTRYDMAFAAGITGVDYDDGFLTPRLGFAVVEG